MGHFNFAIDGSIVGLYLLATMVAGIMVRKYVGRVEDFLVAGREMNVYLGVASLAATEFGIVTCMYTAENGFRYGFAGATPGLLNALAMLVVGLTGFCIRPLRQSGVITLPELFERRFGFRVRRAAGVVIVLGGLLNMGIFLRTGGEFLVQVTGVSVQAAPGAAGLAAWMQGHTLELAMTALLLMVAVYTILGGMLSVLVTDFLQFIVMSVGLLAVTVLILAKVGWGKLVATVQSTYGDGGFNPFVHPRMGWPYVVFNALLNLAAVLTWMAVIQRVLAAKDARTGQKVYTRTSFFFVARFLIPGIWGIAALMAFLVAWHSLQTVAGAILPGIGGISDVTLLAGTNSLQAMPRFLGSFVPVGLMGVLVAAMLAADMSTDSSYMLTWASVIYNDILAPFRKKNWTDKRGLRWNRTIVAAIGVFLLLYGLWYPLKGDLWTYCGVTGTIYLASMSVLLVACCYWKRANSWGAAAAIAMGALMPVLYLVLEQVPATSAWVRGHIGPYYSGIAAYGLAGLAMVAGSLLKPAAREVKP